MFFSFCRIDNKRIDSIVHSPHVMFGINLVWDFYIILLPTHFHEICSSRKLYFLFKIIVGQFEFEELDGRQKESVPITDAGHLSTRMNNIFTITSP